MTTFHSVPISEAYLGLFDGPHATPKLTNAGPIFLGIGNITDDGHLDFSNIRHISEEEYPRWTKRVIPMSGDIVFTYEATLNRYAIIPKGFRGCLGRRMALIRPNSAVIDTNFLFYSFFSPEWRATIASNTMSGATVDRIPLTTFPTFPVRLPPLVVQQRIAAILSAYDELIENNARRIAILEEMAQRIYEEWFIYYRFPGHEAVPLVESELGLVPEGWDVVSAADAVEVNPKVKVPKDGEKPFVPMGCLSEVNMLISNIEARAGNSGAKFQNGDTLFARITPCLENGKTSYVQFLPSPESVAFGSTEFIVLRSRKLTPEFVYLLARSENFRNNAIKSMAGADGRQRVKEACFASYMLAHPDAATLEKFHGLAHPMFDMIHVLARKNENLRQTRDLLLPRLISGELDVSTLPMPEDMAA